MAHATAITGRNPEQTTPMTYEAFLDWSGNEGARGEWVNGEVIVFMPPTILHADLAGFLYTLLSLFARRRGLGRLFVEQVEMKLPGTSASRRPDVLFVAQAHLARLTPFRLNGPADLVVEIVSDDSVTRDRVDKFREYEAAGVPEYWLHDLRPGQRRSDFYRLTANGRYETIDPDPAGRVHSAVLSGFWLRPSWLLEGPLPDPLACLREIAPDP